VLKRSLRHGVTGLRGERRLTERSVGVSCVTDQRVLGDRSMYGPQDQRWNKSEMLAAKMDKFLAVSVTYHLRRL